MATRLRVRTLAGVREHGCFSLRMYTMATQRCRQGVINTHTKHRKTGIWDGLVLESTALSSKAFSSKAFSSTHSLSKHSLPKLSTTHSRPKYSIKYTYSSLLFRQTNVTLENLHCEKNTNATDVLYAWTISRKGGGGVQSIGRRRNKMQTP